MDVKKKDEIFLKLSRDPRLKSVNTQQSYLRTLQLFEKWRGDRTFTKALAEEYLSELKLGGKSPGTVLRAYYAIRWWTKALAEDASGALTQQQAEVIAESAREVAYTRELHMEPDPKEQRLTKSELWDIIKVCLADPTPAGKRDIALILLASQKGIRIEEITGLDFTDFVPENEQEGQLLIQDNSRFVRTIHIDDFTHCALSDWLVIRGYLPGPLFCGVDNRGRIIYRYLSYSTIRIILNKRLEQASVRHLTWSELRQY